MLIISCDLFVLFDGVFSSLSTIFQLYGGGQLYWWRKPEDLGKNHWPVASHWQIYHIMLYTLPWSRCELTTSMVKGTDCIGSCKSIYHTITAMMAHIYTYIYIFELTERGWPQTNCLKKELALHWMKLK